MYIKRYLFQEEKKYSLSKEFFLSNRKKVFDFRNFYLPMEINLPRYIWIHVSQVPGKHEALNCTKNNCLSNYMYVIKGIHGKSTLDGGWKDSLANTQQCKVKIFKTIVYVQCSLFNDIILMIQHTNPHKIPAILVRMEWGGQSLSGEGCW